MRNPHTGRRMSRRGDSRVAVALEPLERRQLLASVTSAIASDALRAAIGRLSNRALYSTQTLRAAHTWAVQVDGPVDTTKLKNQLGASSVKRAKQLANVYVVSFPAKLTGQSIGGAFDKLKLGRKSWPLLARQQTPRSIPNDPQFASQWHLKNTGQGGGVAGADANVTGVWDNYTGAGVTIGVVDDGTTPTHEDLAPNYVAADSWDFNHNDAVPDGGSHGSSVSGVALAKQNNSKGVSGAAPDAWLAGLQLIAGTSTDDMEAAALGYHKDAIDIYTNSWGPNDNGLTLEGPGPLTLQTFSDVVHSGRGGLGGIYTWAGGNGGDGDNVNFDGYANSRYTIAVGALNNFGVRSSYSERGAPLLVSAYSNGGSLGITTTAGFSSNAYTSSFGGTSSAAPLVAGIIADVLQANPNLSWRDVQAILVNSAKMTDASDTGWSVNGAGHHINDKYGYGAIDAAAAVSLAQSWVPLASEVSATTGTINVNQAIPNNSSTGFTYNFSLSNAIKMEGVELVFNASHASRGELQVILTSPSGTQSILATKRADTGDDFNNWVFTTKRLWDENSAGNWSITVTDDSGATAGTFNSFKLNVYGTAAVTTPAVFGVAYDDVNGNGARDGGEPGLAGIQIYIDSDDDGVYDVGEPTATSDGLGGYAIDNLNLGTHVVRAVQPTTRRLSQGSASLSVNLTEQQSTATGVNFGVVNPRVAGVVFNDVNDNGVMDSGESGLSGVNVFIDANNNGTRDAGETTSTSDINGKYILGGLDDGSYIVRAEKPSGRRITLPTTASGSYSATVAGPSSLVFDGRSFGLTDRVRIAGVAFLDKNGNGVREAGEPPIPGTRVFQDLNGNGVYDNTGGTYSSGNVALPVPPGAPSATSGTTVSTLNVSGAGLVSNISVQLNVSHTYDADLNITLISPQGTRVLLTADNGGGGDDYFNTIFDDNAGTAITSGVAPFTGTYRPQQALSALAGENANGVWQLEVVDDAALDSGMLNSWSITVGFTEPSVLTDASGAYSFPALAPGTNYVVREALPAGYVFSGPSSGGSTLNGASGDSLKQDFGNFPVAYTGSHVTARLDPTGNDLQVWVDEPTSGAPTYTIVESLVNVPLEITGTGGDDTLTVDLANGNPIPAGAANAIHFDGLGGNDTIVVLGSSASADTVTFTSAGATANGRAITAANVEQTKFDGRGGGDVLSINAVAPSLQILGTQHLASLTMGAGTNASLASGGSAVLVTDGLSLSPTSLLDLNDNDLIFNYSGASELAAVQALIASARNGGNWLGTSGITSTAARNHPGHQTTLAAIERTDYPLAQFDGEPLGEAAVLVKYTYYGDANLSGAVTFDDYVRIDTGYNTHRTGWANGDFNNDGVVSFDDYVLIDVSFNAQGAPL